MPERAENPKTVIKFLSRSATYVRVSRCRPISESIRQDMALGPFPCLADSRGLVTSTWSNSNDGEHYEQNVIRDAHFSFD
jgi:hypothetical protein